MKLNAKRSTTYAGRSDRQLDIVRLPPIAEQSSSRNPRKRQKKQKNDEHSHALTTTKKKVEWNRHLRKQPFRLTELHLEDRLVDNLRNEIYRRLDRRFHTSSNDVTGSDDRLGDNDDVYRYLQTLKLKEDTYSSIYNDVGLRFGAHHVTTGSESRAQRIPSLNSSESASFSRFVPPFYLSLPGLSHDSDQRGLEAVLESSRSEAVTLGAKTRRAGSSLSRPDDPADSDGDLEVGASPVAPPTDHDLERKQQLDRPEDGLRRKVLEGDFDASDSLHRPATIGFYVHSTFETEYERTVLMERVYPRLREYGNRRGINLEIVDPWWGMDKSGLEENMEQQLLKTTIRRCHDDAKMLGRHPYFVTFLTLSNAPSDVLPTEIPSGEFHSIIDAMSEELVRLQALIEEQKSSKSHSIALTPRTLQDLEEETSESLESPLPDEVDGGDTDVVDSKEEEEKIEVSVEIIKERIQTIRSWYQLYDNETRHVYRLQDPSVLFPDVLSRNGRIRSQARKSWSFVGRNLLKMIQDFASKTLIDDQKELQKYFKSSCEIELDHFLDLTRFEEDSFESCLWFRPEVEDRSDPESVHEGDPGDFEAATVGQHIEFTFDDHLARKLETSLSRKIIHTYALPVGVEGNAAKATRDQLPPYVEPLSSAFEDVVHDVIDRAAEALPADELSTLEREIEAHQSGCRIRVQPFVGRRAELMAIRRYIRSKSHRPFVVSGYTGSGVTSLISMAAIEAKNWIKRRSSTVVRLVGETVESQTVMPLLRSLCLQLSYLQSLNHDLASDHLEAVPREWNALFNDFRSRLESLSRHQTIIIFIDSVHELQASNDRDRFLWIPATLPSNVRIVISTTGDQANPSLRWLRNWNPSDETEKELSSLELGEFPRSDVAKVTHGWLSDRDNKSVTERQQRIIEESFDACPSPLFVQLVLDEASRWTSSTEVKLGLTTRSVVLSLLGRLEREYGDLMVRRALGYMALARYGLTQNELADLLCLDELVSEEVHVLQRPPLRRLPPLMLLRFLAEIRALVKECHSDGYPMKRLAHDLFRQIVEERYIKDGKTRRAYHKIMAEYFSDQGTSDGKRDGKGEGKGDWKAAAKPVITAQPLYWEDVEGEDKEKNHRRVYNSRRLDELPHHLTFSQQVDKLKEFCFCNQDYLLARIESSPLGLHQLVSDLEIALVVERDDLELRLVLSAVRVSTSVIAEDARQVTAQLAGRLLQTLASDKPVTERDPDRYPYLKTMLRRARDGATYSSLVALIPSVSCLVSPSGASCQWLSAHRGPITALTTSSDGLRAVTTSKDDTMRSWDLVTGWVLQKICGVGRDVYEVRYASGDTMAVTSEVGLLRIWDLRTSECLRTMRGFEDPAALAIASGGTLLAAVFHGSNHLRVWSLEGQFELLRETTIQETWKPVRKDCTTFLSKTCVGATILYALRDSNVATAYDLKEGKVVRKMRIHESGSITAVVMSRAYCICAARYPETKQLNRVRLEVFDLENGKQLRSIKCCDWDVIQELSVNAIGSHVVAFCSNRTTGKSFVSTWNIETEDHKHVAKHGGSPVLGAVGDLRFVLTVTDDCDPVRVWNIKESVEAKTAKERSRCGVTRILTMRDHPQYVLAQSTDGRKVDVWNVAMHDFCGSVVHSQPELTAGSDDVLLLHNGLVVILSVKEYVKMDEAEEDEVLVYRTMKVYDLHLGRWRSEVDSLAIPVFPVDDYCLLSDEQLLGPSDSRSQFLIWEVATGNVLFQIKIPFREREPTADLDDEYPSIGPGSRSASSAKMTPWSRRSETRTARGRRHHAVVDEARRRRQEIQSERHNCIDRFLVSENRSTIVASFYGHHLCVFDMESHRQVRVLRSPSSMMQLTVSDITCDGCHLVNVTYDDDEKEGLVSLWDTRSGFVTRRLSHDGWINAIAVSDDARRVVFCSQSKSLVVRNRLCIWQPEAQLCPDLLEIPGHKRFNNGVDAHLRLTRESTLAVVCAGDISVWDLEQSALLCVFSPDSRIQCFELALNGQLIVFGLQDVPSIVTLKMVSSRFQDSVKVTAGACLFGEDPMEVMKNGEGDLDDDMSEKKIRINPSLFFQSSDDA